MTRRALSANVGGRVRKVRTNDFLVALYEAISNSIHAIDAARRDGAIVVEVLRQPRQGEMKPMLTGDLMPISGFTITDNGIGFTPENLTSFGEADSTFKEKIGGKGVGRFTWLKFFEQANVDSVFEDGGKLFRRTFSFSRSGIDDADPIEVTSEIRTAVTLSPLYPEHVSAATKTLDQVSIGIIEHFIAYFVTGSIPKVTVQDGAASQDVVALYQSSIGKHSTNHQFDLNGNKFTATGIRFHRGDAHTAFLCAHGRAAEKIPLAKRDPFFRRKFVDEDLQHYAFCLFVESPYLNGIVNDDRDGFHFPEAASLATTAQAGGVTKDEVLEQIVSVSQDAMSSEIASLKEANVAKVRAFVATEAPQYRYVLARNPEAAAKMHATDKAELDQALRRLQFEDELQTRAQISSLLRKAEEVGGPARDEWAKQSTDVIAKLSEEGKASLAGYIVRRRQLLEVLQKRMQIADGKYAREEAVHQLIFPMRTTSDDVSYEDQNLWLIDERLAYHYYLASDTPLAKIPAAETDSKKEPDIVVFNLPIALNDRPEEERLESVVIIEFKRPGESAVDGEKNPVDQILAYIELIRDGKAKSRKGRPLQATSALYFFGYAICELDAALKKVLKRRTMKETPDGRGMFGFFPDHNAYIEVVSYEKMIDDAVKRNRILFEKLQLPPRV